jgi:hypothetical protein
MGAASFCGGVRHKRYSGQLEIAPENFYSLIIKKLNVILNNLNFLMVKKIKKDGSRSGEYSPISPLNNNAKQELPQLLILMIVELPIRFQLV